MVRKRERERLREWERCNSCRWEVKNNNHSESNNSSPSFCPHPSIPSSIHPLRPTHAYIQTNIYIQCFYFYLFSLLVCEILYCLREKRKMQKCKKWKSRHSTPPPYFPRRPIFLLVELLNSALCLCRLLIGGFKEQKKKKKKRLLVLYWRPFWFVAPLNPPSPPLPIRPSRYLTVQQDHVATVYKLPWGLPLPNQHCNVFSSVCSMFLDCYIVYMNKKKKRKTTIKY